MSVDIGTEETDKSDKQMYQSEHMQLSTLPPHRTAPHSTNNSDNIFSEQLTFLFTKVCCTSSATAAAATTPLSSSAVVAAAAATSSVTVNNFPWHINKYTRYFAIVNKM